MFLAPGECRALGKRLKLGSAPIHSLASAINRTIHWQRGPPSSLTPNTVTSYPHYTWNSVSLFADCYCSLYKLSLSKQQQSISIPTSRSLSGLFRLVQPTSAEGCMRRKKGITSLALPAGRIDRTRAFMGIYCPGNTASYSEPSYRFKLSSLAAVSDLDGGRIGVSLSRR